MGAAAMCRVSRARRQRGEARRSGRQGQRTPAASAASQLGHHTSALRRIRCANQAGARFPRFGRTSHIPVANDILRCDLTNSVSLVRSYPHMDAFRQTWRDPRIPQPLRPKGRAWQGDRQEICPPQLQARYRALPCAREGYPSPRARRSRDALSRDDAGRGLLSRPRLRTHRRSTLL